MTYLANPAGEVLNVFGTPRLYMVPRAFTHGVESRGSFSDPYSRTGNYHFDFSNWYYNSAPADLFGPGGVDFHNYALNGSHRAPIVRSLWTPMTRESYLASHGATTGSERTFHESVWPFGRLGEIKGYQIGDYTFYLPEGRGQSFQTAMGRWKGNTNANVYQYTDPGNGSGYSTANISKWTYPEHVFWSLKNESSYGVSGLVNDVVYDELIDPTSLVDGNAMAFPRAYPAPVDGTPSAIADARAAALSDLENHRSYVDATLQRTRDVLDQLAYAGAVKAYVGLAGWNYPTNPAKIDNDYTLRSMIDLSNVSFVPAYYAEVSLFEDDQVARPTFSNVDLMELAGADNYFDYDVERALLLAYYGELEDASQNIVIGELLGYFPSIEYPQLGGGNVVDTVAMNYQRFWYDGFASHIEDPQVAVGGGWTSADVQAEVAGSVVLTSVHMLAQAADQLAINTSVMDYPKRGRYSALSSHVLSRLAERLRSSMISSGITHEGIISYVSVLRDQYSEYDSVLWDNIARATDSDQLVGTRNTMIIGPRGGSALIASMGFEVHDVTDDVYQAVKETEATYELALRRSLIQGNHRIRYFTPTGFNAVVCHSVCRDSLMNVAIFVPEDELIVQFRTNVPEGAKPVTPYLKSLTQGTVSKLVTSGNIDDGSLAIVEVSTQTVEQLFGEIPVVVSDSTTLQAVLDVAVSQSPTYLPRDTGGI